MLEMEQQLKEEKQKKMNRVNDSMKVTYDFEGKLLKVKPVNGNNLKQLDADKDILGYNLIQSRSPSKLRAKIKRDQQDIKSLDPNSSLLDDVLQ